MMISNRNGSLMKNSKVGHALNHIYKKLGMGTKNKLLCMELIKMISLMGVFTNADIS